MPEIVLTERDNEQAVSLVVGDVLTIRLPENPTTGFRWQTDRTEASGVLDPMADFFAPSPVGAIGAGGTRVLRWTATSQGHAEIRLELMRTWEARPSGSSFVVHVSVT